MTQEDKELLLKDLCGRLPYGVEADCVGEYVKIKYIDPHRSTAYISNLGKTKWESIEVITPYLRPMESMTEEEEKEYINIDNLSYSCPMIYAHFPAFKRMDWLNAHHFDYRGLIPKGLAIAVIEENNPYKE